MEAIFKLNVESNRDCFSFCSTLLCDSFRKLEPFSQPIRCKAKTNHDLVTRVTNHDLLTRVFLRFRHLSQFHFEFSLALKVFPFLLIGS